MACPGSSDIAEPLAASGGETKLQEATSGCESIQEVAGELKAARTELLKHFNESDGVINLLLSADLKLEAQTLSDIASQLLDILKHIHEYLAKLRPEFQHLLGEVICSESVGSITLMYKFHHSYFQKLGTGLDQDLVYSLLYVLIVLERLTEGSKGVCKYLVSSGSLYQNFFELEELKKTLSDDKIAYKFVICNLMVLYNCSSELGFHRYFLRLDPVYFWQPFCSSPSFCIRVHSRFIAGRLAPHIPWMSLKMIELEDSDVKSLCEILGEVSASEKFEVRCFECIFSAAELVSGIRSLFRSSLNRKKLLHNEVLTSLVAILVGGGVTEKKEVCLAIWDLVADENFAVALDAVDLPLGDILTELGSKFDTEFDLLLSGLTCSLPSQDVKPCPEVSYKYGHYDLCIKQCDKITSDDDAIVQSTHLLQAKCLYHVYRKEKLILAHSNVEEKDLQEVRNNCYSKARDAIICLGKLDLDSEGECMLDFAMMEYATETNRLDDIRRCLLCQRKDKLQRSHMCPYSILKEFCSGMIRSENQQSLETSSDSSKIGHLKSPKEVTIYAFCKSCENKLSTYGERDFLPHFFRKIYFPNDIESEKSIEYGPWLYHFCVGMLFRALIRSNISCFSNSDEVYNLFVMFRRIVLNPSLQEKPDCDLPKIYILIGPQKGRDQDQLYGFMSQALNDPYFSAVPDSSLFDGTTKPPYPAHYVLVHIGVIHIITIFSPSNLCILPTECQINPVDGEFKIPQEEERGNSFTPGLWSFFQHYAVEKSRLWLERPLAPLVRSQKHKKIVPPSDLKNLFQFQSSVESDLKTFETNITPSPDPNAPRIITLLPSGFHFRPRSNRNCIQLPDNHQILFHFVPQGDKEVYFLAVGQGKRFDYSTPYVIYSHCEPGLQFSSGFFVDPIELTFKEFLPFREGRVLLERLAIIDNLKTNIQDILKKMLKCKGVACLSDVLQMCRLDKGTKSQNFDLKCFGREYCWYCSSRCSFCLQLAGSNYSKLEGFGRTLRFCSQECLEKLKTAVPLKVALHQPQGDDGKCVALKISGTGQIPSSELVYLVSITIYIGPASDSASFKTFAYFQSRSFSLQVIFQLSVGEHKSKVRLSPLHELSQNAEDSFNTLLLQSLSHLSLKEDLSLKSIHTFSMSKFQTSTESIACSLDTAVALKLPIPTLVVSIANADDLVKKAKSDTDSQHTESDKEKDQDGSEAVLEKASTFITFEITEDHLSGFLKALPANSVVSTKFSTSVSFVNFITNYHVQARYLTMKLLEEFCVMHFNEVNDVLRIPLNETNDSNETIYKILLEHLSKAKMCMKHIPALGLKNIGDDVGSKMRTFTSTLCQLCELLYCGLNVGLSAAASQCFLTSLTTTASLCSCSSSLRNKLLSSTNIVHILLRQLQELRQVVPLDEFIKKLIVATLQLCGSLTKERGHHWQFKEADFPNIALPYLCSSLNNIALAAKIALVPFFQEIERDKISLSDVPESIVSELKSSQLATVSISNLSVTQVEILWFVKMLLFHKNSPLSITSNLSDVLDGISSVMQQGSDFLLETKAAVDLLWALVYKGWSSNILSHPDLTAQLLSLTAEEEELLQRMASCVLWKLGLYQQEMPEFYIEECYLNGYYSECVSECESFFQTSSLDESSELYTSIMLTHAKALFHTNCVEQEMLKKCLPNEIRLATSACYSKIKQVIQELGSLFDRDQLDDEGSRVLDLSMIDYIYQSGRSCQRCLLCRKKSDLKKSHIWPRALLEDFSSGVEMPKSRRVLLVKGHSQSKYLSPKEVTFYVFCESCEGLLSKHGEAQFVPKFFRKIYDVAITGKPQSASTIEYGNWLYEFCIGIIFRGIAQRNMLKFVNSEEIYAVLVLCRSFLLECSKDTTSSAPKVGKLDVFIMISPTEARGKDTESGFINRVLNMPALYGVEEIELNDGSVTIPRTAQFFIAHFGLINILTKFECSAYTFPIESKIDPSCGTFIVPENEHRKRVLPVGVWNLFLRLAQDFEVHWLTRSVEAVEKYSRPEKKQPKKINEETFGFVSATQKDFEALKLHVGPPAPNNEYKDVSFLPEQFKVHRSNRQSYIRLPKFHHVLLHFLIPLKQEAQETMFLCVGNDETYSYQKPYVIYHFFQQDGFQLSAGFFISPTDLTAQEFLPESAEKAEVGKVACVSVFRSYIPKLLSAILEQKGFFCFSSLYLRLQSGGDISTVDMKCVSPSRCWYCINRCELCMKETEIGCLWITNGPIPLCFCSKCQHHYTEKKSQLVTKVHVPETGDPVPLAVAPLASSHRALLYVACQFTTGKGAPVLMRMALCSGKHSETFPIEAPYVMYHFWTLFQQQFLEFTVSPDMTPNKPVAYTETSNSQKAFSEHKEGPIQNVLNEAIKAAKFENVDVLMSRD